MSGVGKKSEMAQTSFGENQYFQIRLDMNTIVLQVHNSNVDQR